MEGRRRPATVSWSGGGTASRFEDRDEHVRRAGARQLAVAQIDGVLEHAGECDVAGAPVRGHAVVRRVEVARPPATMRRVAAGACGRMIAAEPRFPRASLMRTPTILGLTGAALVAATTACSAEVTLFGGGGGAGGQGGAASGLGGFHFDQGGSSGGPSSGPSTGSSGNASGGATSASNGVGGGTAECAAGLDTACEQCFASNCEQEWLLCAYYSNCDEAGEPSDGCLLLVRCALDHCDGDLACAQQACPEEYQSAGGPDGFGTVAAEPLANCIEVKCGGTCP
jgi:hypothetical protein